MAEFPELVLIAKKAFTSVVKRSLRFKNGYMVLSDLCGSTDLSFRNLQAGAALQAAHEALCAALANMTFESPHFKSLGDGIMMELSDPLNACQIALQLIDASRDLRERAESGAVPPEFATFVVKVVGGR